MAFQFSANTGFLWKELPFLQRIKKAAEHGFDALEFHDEAQSEDPVELKALFEDIGLPVLGLNVKMGDTAGCAAIPGRESDARADILDAAKIADEIGAGAIHVLCGKTDAAEAEAVFIENLKFALYCFKGTILIEPLCQMKMPGYFLNTVEHAAAIIDKVDDPRLKIMFDCFHVETESGGTLDLFQKHIDKIGHVQIASVPARAEPGAGHLDYAALLPAMREAGYHGAFGCEYTPASTVEADLSWMTAFREAS